MSRHKRCAKTMIQIDTEAVEKPPFGDSYDQESENGYQVLSSKGRNLGGPYGTLDKAKKRLRQVEFFKCRDAKTRRAKR